MVLGRRKDGEVRGEERDMARVWQEEREGERRKGGRRR